MQKLFLRNRFQAPLASLLLLAAITARAWGDDGFALAVGPHDALDIFGPKGDKVAELAAPAISQAVTVGATSFQVSYGRDANDLLTAILTPSPTQPQSLHFNVLNKSVDSDKQAVVTLTFAPGQKHVTIDPGYVGVVHVDAHAVRHHELASSDYAPQSAYRLTPATAPRTSSNIEPGDAMPGSSSASYLPPTTSTTTSTATLAAMDAPPDTGLPTGNVVQNNPTPTKLYWAEPVTPINGPAPKVASDQMMLVEVHGSVTVKTPDGQTAVGTNGMLVPSGAIVATAPNASAAVFMGGINSARFLPQSEASVAQNVNGSVRKTTVDLHKGTVFSRVGRRAGETEDYKVHTPEGVAAAHGTEFLVTIAKSGDQSFTLCFVKNSEVGLTDNSGKQTFTITTQGNNQVAFASFPHLPPEAAKGALIDILTVLQQFNTKIEAIANALLDDPGSVSKAERDFYNSNKDAVTALTKLLDDEDNSLSSLFGTTDSSASAANSDGTTTTTTVSTSGSTTVVTKVTTDNATGDVLSVVTTVLTNNGDGTETTVTTTFNVSDGIVTISSITTGPTSAPPGTPPPPPADTNTGNGTGTGNNTGNGNGTGTTAPPDTGAPPIPPPPPPGVLSNDVNNLSSF